MSADASPIPAAARRPALTLSRLARLALKELKETLRDRRTVITLVLMPALLYPLLSLAFRQFVLSNVPRESESRVRIGLATDAEQELLLQLLEAGDAVLDSHAAPAASDARSAIELAPPSELAQSALQFYTSRDPSLPIQDLPVDIAVRIETQPPEAGGPGTPRYAVRIWYLPASPVSCQAARHIRQRLQAVNGEYLRQHLLHLEPQGVAAAPALAWDFAQLSGTHTRTFWLASLVPLVLITMTITGAVYPAIDLTAGERERGTLEALMAAPVHRLGLLLAKYIAVVTVAMLTAVMNLLAMTITVASSGLGPALFGERGLSIGSMATVFALLVLFAAFFSAVLLSITSFARSFKEAQAYLIPLMLISLAPGFLSVMPDLELNALLSVTPLANIVLLARDVLEGDAPPLWAAVAVLSTLLYGAVALAIAARIFGSDAILYGSEGSWGDLFRRPAQPRSQAALAGALAALAVVVPLYILLSGVPGMFSLSTQMALNGAVLVLIFLVTPLLLARWQGVSVAGGFQLRGASWLSFLGAIVCGFALAPIAYELIVVSREFGITTISDAEFQKLGGKVQTMVSQWRELHPLAILVPMALVTAICEEWFFRGYLLGALRGRAPAWFAIGATAVVFGVFHASVGGGLILVERVLSSTMIGLVLGWLCWTSFSVVPGMVTHAIINGLMLSLIYWGDGLKSLGLDIQDQQHLPPVWLLGAALLTAIGLLLTYWGRRPDGSSIPALEAIKPPLAEPHAG